VRKKLALVVVVLGVVLAGLAIVWKLRRGDGGSADHPSSGSAASGAPAGGRGGAAKASSTPASVGGRVIRKADGAGIAGALVSLARAELGATMFEAADAPTLVIATDARGVWTAPSVAPGAYVLAVTATGYLPATRDKLSVASGERTTGIDFALEAGGTLVSGTVTDVGGGPIAGARITVSRSDSIKMGGEAELVAIAGANGTYQIALANGAFTAEATHDDYTHASRHFELDGKPLTIDFVLTPGGTIRGQVVTRGGKPVPGAMIEAGGGKSHARTDHKTVVADATGNFVLSSLGSGAISISAAGRGFASSSPTVVELGIGEEVDGVRVIVDTAFSISGRVVNKVKPAEGIAGVRIGVFSISGGEQAMAPDPTGSDGAFEIVGVRAASYMMFAIGDGVMPEIGKPIEVADKDVKDVIVEMSFGVTVSGRVDPAAIAVLGISPEKIGLGNMFDAVKAMLVHGDSDASGAFVMRNVPPGSFTLTAKTTDGRAGKLALTVGDVDQANVVVKLEKRASIAGRVIDDKGAPVAGVHVSAHGHGDTMDAMISVNEMRGGGVVTAVDGSFRVLGLEAGKIGVTVSDDQGQLAWTDAAHKAKPREAITFELQPAADLTGITLTVESRDGVIRGQVLGADRKPAADAWVTATAESTATPGAAKQEAMMAELRRMQSHAPVLTNAEGRFTIDKLRRGSYELVAEGAKGSSRVQKAGVKTGDTVTLALEPLGTLSGHVTTGGAPVTSYDLSCESPVGTIHRRITAADGGYTLEHLAPGAYACEAFADTGSATGKVDVPAGDAKLELALVRWASITGTVVSVLSGQPVVGLKIMAGSENLDQRSMSDILSGKGPTTDASGRFAVPRVQPGTGKVAIIPAAGSFEQLASRDYTVTTGQQLDLGTIKVVPPRTGDAGTLGFSTSIEGETPTVDSVKPGGPAETAGLRVGDKITTIDGHTVAELTPMIAKTLISSGNVAIDQAVRIGVDRGGTPAQLTIVAIKW
jgi:hypothetical protein